MKQLFFLVIGFFTVTAVLAQQTPDAQVAHKIADKLKDSLQLTNPQRAKLFQVNHDLSKQKKTARTSSQDRAVVGRELQRIEASRDSLYKTVLTSEQFLLYLKKKRNIVNNN